MSAITYTQFLAYSGYTEATIPNEAYARWILGGVCDILEDHLNIKFSLTSDKTKNYPGKNVDYLVIGGWQKEGLNIKTKNRGILSNSLVLDKDYSLTHFKDNEDKPVIGVKFLSSFWGYYYNFYQNYGMAYNHINYLPVDVDLVVNGTYGWSNGFPTDLQIAVFELVNKMVRTNQLMSESDGAGFSTGLKSVTLSENYKISDELIAQLVNMGFDPAGAKQIQSVAKRYTANSKQKVRIS